MSSPFPGMDPYLETPDLWSDVHHGLISQVQAMLNPVIRPHYVARVVFRGYVPDEDDFGREAVVPDICVEKRKAEGSKNTNGGPALAIAEPLIIPLLIDDEIEEARLEIKHLESGALVTVIEVLSPTNKIRGARGRSSVMEKRNEVLASDVHWVEIDLLRAGVPSVTRPPLAPSDYRILVSRAGEHDQGRYWPFSVRQPLPVIGIPLRSPDPDVPLDFGAVMKAAYEQGAYDLSIDYHQDPVPPLKAEDAAWAGGLLREHEKRLKEWS